MAKKAVKSKAKESPWNIKKTVFIPRIPGAKKQADIVVSINNKTFLIKRGENVEVPLPVYNVLKRSMRAQEKAEEYYYGKSGIKSN